MFHVIPCSPKEAPARTRDCDYTSKAFGNNEEKSVTRQTGPCGGSATSLHHTGSVHPSQGNDTQNQLGVISSQYRCGRFKAAGIDVDVFYTTLVRATQAKNKKHYLYAKAAT